MNLDDGAGQRHGLDLDANDLTALVARGQTEHHPGGERAQRRLKTDLFGEDGKAGQQQYKLADLDRGVDRDRTQREQKKRDNQHQPVREKYPPQERQRTPSP